MRGFQQDLFLLGDISFCPNAGSAPSREVSHASRVANGTLALNARYFATFTYRPESFTRHLTTRSTSVGKIFCVRRKSFGEVWAAA